MIDSNTTAADIRATIETAKPGAIVYFEDSATINLTGMSNIVVPPRVTLASGRGDGSSGAIIKTDDFAIWTYEPEPGRWTQDEGKEQPLFQVGGSGVRITGVRLYGPFTGDGTRPNTRQKTGVSTNGYGDFELDNSELKGFPTAAFSARAGTTERGEPRISYEGIQVHHNHIHHNTQKGYGYGVVVDDSYVTVYANRFHHNRHDIAGTGASGSGYEAFCNEILSGGISHNFDMHGADGDSLTHAGRMIYIHHNTFYDTGENRESGSTNKANIRIRGKPEAVCLVEYNVFAHSSVAVAIQQYRKDADPAGFGNLLVWNNIYAHEYYLGWYVSPKWNRSRTRINNYVIIPSTNDALMSSMGDKSRIDYALGDFDGDGATDVLKFDGDAWYTLPVRVPANRRSYQWTRINYPTSIDVSRLAFGHFDKDASTDAFRANGLNWFVSYGAVSSWQKINTSVFELSKIRLADFDGDGLTDVFRTNGKEWYLSYSGSTKWTRINTSGYPMSQLAVGDFDGDGKADIFVGTGTRWEVSYGGTSSWKTLNSPTSYRAPDCTFGDWTGNNRTDVMALVNGVWSISIDGVGQWTQLRSTYFPPSTLPFGEF